MAQSVCIWCERIEVENPAMLTHFTPDQLHQGHETVDEWLRFWNSPQGWAIKAYRKPAKARRKGKV